MALAMDALENGHFQALGTPWCKIAYTQPLGHCEGPDHLERLDLLIRLRQEIASATPDQLRPIYRSLVKQAEDVRRVIAIFGRHPHRNESLGRQSTPAEKEYLENGDLPYLRAFQADRCRD